MNDRYLYRAKRTDNGEWIEGYYAYAYEKHYIMTVGATCALPPYHWYFQNNEVDPSTICQCTGLKDKNGKLIWENDKCMVRRPCVLAYGTIKYLDGCFCFVEDKTGNILRLCDVKTNGFEIKVESNIFDNPELLEPELLEVEHE